MKFIILILFSLLISGCSDISDKEVLNIDYKLVESYTWINLMPGSPASFHFSGQFIFRNNEKEILKPFSITKVLVYQNNSFLFEIEPDLKEGVDNRYVDFAPAMEKKYNVGAGIVLGDKKLNADQNIKIELLINSLEKIKVISLDSVKVEKIY